MTNNDFPADDLALSDKQRALREEFIRVRGSWGEPWQRILELDPRFLQAYLDFSAVPWRKQHLEPKVKSFMYIAMCSSATHMYLPGVRTHIRNALDAGATSAEVMEVIELTSTLGIHAANIGVPLLIEVLEELGMRDGAAPLDERRAALKESFTARRGYWHPFWDGLLELDPELFEAYTEFSSVPWDHGVLEPKIKELVYIAFDAASTHLFVPGLKLHLRNALTLGATVDEIMEVLDIVSVLGIHAATTGVPILAEELQRPADSPTAG